MKRSLERILILLECGLVLTLCWQTRFSLQPWLGEWPKLYTDYLIPFIYVADIFLVLVLGCWLLLSWRQLGEWLRRIFQTNWRWWLAWPAVWWLGLLLVAGLSIVMNGSELWSWYRWFKLLEAGLLGMWIYGRWGSGRWRLFGGMFLLSLGIEATIMVGEWWRQSSLGLQWLGEWRFDLYTPGIAKVVWHNQIWLRPMATFAHPNIAAGILVCSLPLAGLWMRVALPEEHRGLVWLWWSMVLLAIGVAFSRLAWILLLVFIGYQAIRWWKDKRWLRYHFDGRWWLMIGLGLLLMSWVVMPVVVDRFASLGTTDSWSLGIRLDLSSVAWRLWQQHLWWGIGLNTFTLHVPALLGGALVWPQPVHAVWLLVLTEVGLVGFLAWLGIGWCVMLQLYESWRQHRHDSLVWAVIMTWVAVIVLSFFDHYWWTSQPGILLLGGLVGGSSLVCRLRLPVIG